MNAVTNLFNPLADQLSRSIEFRVKLSQCTSDHCMKITLFQISVPSIEKETTGTSLKPSGNGTLLACWNDDVILLQDNTHTARKTQELLKVQVSLATLQPRFGQSGFQTHHLEQSSLQTVMENSCREQLNGRSVI
ncbi:hypothetical protein AVEN_223783-1 [Araneus ventricosus]|uniref:Uncharacterized protein n=1 Tax=Araneus ventricosus TaxID=182803 RepID=A0A4Y2DM02_ARAVE|nr:hypothetical protein AVEN_223783-1 [Araneus ventricosus]